MYRIRITDLDELKQRLRAELAKLDHVVIAAASAFFVTVRAGTAYRKI